jgi:hypothetical protein
VWFVFEPTVDTFTQAHQQIMRRCTHGLWRPIDHLEIILLMTVVTKRAGHGIRFAHFICIEAGHLKPVMAARHHENNEAYACYECVTDG